MQSPLQRTPALLHSGPALAMPCSPHAEWDTCRAELLLAGAPFAAASAAPSGIAPAGPPGQQVVMPLEQALFLMDQAKKLQQQQGLQAPPTSSIYSQAPHMGFQHPPQQAWQGASGPTPPHPQQWGSQGSLGPSASLLTSPQAPFGSFGGSIPQPSGAASAYDHPSSGFDASAYGPAGSFSAPGSFNPPTHSHQSQQFGAYGSMQPGMDQAGMQSGPSVMNGGQRMQWGQGQGQPDWAAPGFQAGGIAPLRGGRSGGPSRPFQQGRHFRGRRGR